jgi:hypothetical protein
MLNEEQSKATLFNTMSNTAVAWMDRKTNPKGFDVAEGSEFAYDDTAIHPYQVSLAVTTGLNAAIDHLHAFYGLLMCTGFLHSNAPSTVLRGALETASAAVWIAQPDDRTERVYRTLRWFGKDAKDGKTAMAAGPTAPLEQRQADLMAIATAHGLDPKVVKNGYTSTEAVTAARDQVGPEFPDVLLAWQLCSGFAHGRFWSQLGYTATTTSPIEGKPGISMVEFAPGYDRLLPLAIATQRTIEMALMLFDRRGRRP